MELHKLVAPATLLTMGTLAGSANAATTINTPFVATPGGTPITLAGASSPQFTFVQFPIVAGVPDFTKTELSGNGGAMVADPVTQTFSQFQVTNAFNESPGFANPGNYGIKFSANGVNFQGLATVLSDGNTIQGITFSALSGGVPEPGTWAMMVLGFGFAAGAMRRRRAQGAALTA